MVATSLIAVVSLICAAPLAIGFDFVVPASIVVGSSLDVLAVGSGFFLVGLLDGD